MNWEKVRDEFPVCTKYVYLNPAGGSPLSVSAANGAQRFYNEMLEYGDTLYEDWMRQTEEIRKKLADFIGAGSDEIAFTSNTSHGMNLVAQALRDRGDVVTMQSEFPSSTLPWLNQDVAVTMVEPEGVAYPLDRIKQYLTGKTKILVASYVQYATGYRQNLEQLGAFCRKNNLIFVVNATQAFGIFPIDVEKFNIDFLVFSGLKWATAGYGAGAIYVRKKWLTLAKMPFVGWQSVDQPGLMDNRRMQLKPEASLLEGGCPSFPTIFSLGGAIDLFNRIGKQNVMERVLYLSNILSENLKNINLPVISPENDSNRSGIVIIKTPNAKEIVKKLAEKKIFVSARGEGLRVSVSIFNNERDINLFIQEVSKMPEQF